MTEVVQIDHININTADLPSTIAFYEKVLDLKTGPTPDLGRPLQWMYAGDKPLFHIGAPAEGEDMKFGVGELGFSHIALHITDYDKAKKRLEDNGVEYSTNELTKPRLVRQLFFMAPDEVEIELIAIEG